MAYSICKIKNLTGEVATLNGHQFSIGEVYTIQDVVRLSWSSSDSVLQAISDGDFQIYDGDQAVSSVSDQIDWLKDHTPINAVTIKTDEYTYEANAFSASCSNGSTTVDFKVENYTGQSFTYKHISGGMIFINDNTKYGMYADFQVVDKDNILGYGANTVLKQYIHKIYINPTCPAHFGTEPPGAIPVGLYLRANITNPHQDAITCYINLDMYTKDES